MPTVETKPKKKQEEGSEEEGSEEEEGGDELREQFRSVIDEEFSKIVDEAVDKKAAARVKQAIRELRSEQSIFGHDKTGLDSEQKMQIVTVARAAAGNGKAEKDYMDNIASKASNGNALISDEDDRGGFLVPTDVSNAILRIAASVGLVMNRAQRFDMNTDELRIPSYRGSFLEGEYIDNMQETAATSLTFNSARLIAKTWQLVFAVSNELLRDAGPNVADWLMSLAGEAMANMIDKQGFNGTGNPFVGVLNDPNVTTYTLASGTNFSDFDPIVDGSDVPAQLDKSIRAGAAYYMEDTVWAKIRQKKDDNGQPVLSFGGQPSQIVMQRFQSETALQPDGELNGFPVFTTKHLPANSADAKDTKYITFGNFEAAAFGLREGLSMSEHSSGTFDGVEVARANATGMVFRNRNAFVNALPGAFVNVKTNA